jgi:hypothetical protein
VELAPATLTVTTTFDETTRSTTKTVLARALSMRSRLAREGWWN